MSQIPDVNRDFAEVHAMFAGFDALRRKRGRQRSDVFREALAVVQRRGDVEIDPPARNRCVVAR